jgi:hypothetical protein
MNQLEAREILYDFIERNWSDQKVAEVLAFAEDGKMDYFNPCACFIGVHSSDAPHVKCDHVIRASRTTWLHPGHHYRLAKVRSYELIESEEAYLLLGKEDGKTFYLRTGQPLRDQRFIEILRDVIRHRDAQKEKQIAPGASYTSDCQTLEQELEVAK